MYSSEKVTNEKEVNKPLSMPGAEQGKYLELVQHHCQDTRATTLETAGQFNIHRTISWAYSDVSNSYSRNVFLFHFM